MNPHRDRFAAARVAVLGSVTPEGNPHLVPVAFALDGETSTTRFPHVTASANAPRSKWIRAMAASASAFPGATPSAWR